MTGSETITLNLMEDVWTALHLTPECVMADTGKGNTGLYVLLTDADDPAIRYYVDNGHEAIPDGKGLRVRYAATGGPVLFSVDNPTGDPLAWQQKGVEPMLVAIRNHAEDVRATSSINTAFKAAVN
jgi:hypothetical protein